MSKLKKKRIVLSGYFGFCNCGDEGVLMAMLQTLQTLYPNLDITVLSGDPDQTKANFGVHAVSRWNLAAAAWKLLGADLFISGGGSLLQDVTSAKSPLYYLGMINLARRLSKKTMIYAQGIGPLNFAKNRKYTVRILEGCDVITLRDQESADELAAMGLKKSVAVTADPVLALERKDVQEAPGRLLLQELGLLDTQGAKKRPLLIAALRSWKEDDYFDKIGAALDAKSAQGWDIL
ncbi:MAG TPA: polysaccharide pyruvyl transferase CsaB, partial [Peptococcaceae bacterium]|nr:polysaccharide pyruvyl transferase CsaB [Peptococcaceae bacterium]